MEIYILRNGERIGPFSKDAAQILIEQGTVSSTDLGWQPGAFDWRPLSDLLGTAPVEAPQAAEPSSQPPAVADAEPATAAQIAFLSYFGSTISQGLTKDAAEALVTTAREDPANAKRLASWETDRMRLHPDLFNPEPQPRQEDRVELFLELCQTEGADRFTGVTKAHCQVLVAFLDVKYPRWDANRTEATERYFFPALAEKFPQLVNKAWRGRPRAAHRASNSDIIARAQRGLPKIAPEKPPVSPLAAIVRGIFIGVVILALLYAAHYYMQIRKGQSTPNEHTALDFPTFAAIGIHSR